MDIFDFIFNPFVILIVLFIVIPVIRYVLYRREEEEFFNRMYWTMRDAHEDAQHQTDDEDKTN
jgi:hypothetical protein